VYDHTIFRPEHIDDLFRDAAILPFPAVQERMLRQTLAGQRRRLGAATVAAPLAAIKKSRCLTYRDCMAMVLSEAGIARPHFSAV